MKESTRRVAVLDDVEVDAFAGLCEYLYTGSYTTPSIPATYIHSIETHDAGGHTAPREGQPVTRSRIRMALTGSYEKQPNSLDYVFTSLHDEGKKEAQRDVSGKLSKQFRKPKYSGSTASATSYPDIRFHAKLYVLATRFLVEPLRQQCLASLHRDLKALLSRSTEPLLIVELLDFTYKNTGPSEPGGGSPLRELVSLYASCKASNLFKNDVFRMLLRKNGDIGADIITRLVQ